jgi:transcription antitermination factor NusG
MPLLPAEPVVSPENLFDYSANPIGDDCWWVLHTRPRAEKSLARRLSKRGVAYFLPQYRKISRHNGRIMTSYMPLFPGYVFLHGDGSARLAALETNLVANVINVVEQQDLQRDLSQVHALVTSGAALTPEEKLQKGQAVELTSGPFAGMEGRILNRNKLRFVVEVRFLQQGVSVDVEAWMIRPLERNRAMAACV